MDNYELDSIRKRLKLETLSSKENRYRYYTYLIDLFKYGIITDDLLNIIERDIEMIIPERGLTILENLKINKGNTFEVNIELSDNYPDEEDNNLLMVYVEFIDKDLLDRCILLDNKFDNKISSLMRGIFVDYSHGMLLQALSLISLLMPIRLLKRIIKAVEIAFENEGFNLKIKNINLFIMQKTTLMEDFYIPYEDLDNYDDNKSLLHYYYEGELQRC